VHPVSPHPKKQQKQVQPSDFQATVTYKTNQLLSEVLQAQVVENRMLLRTTNHLRQWEVLVATLWDMTPWS
jgi:hypothetical protein